MAQDRRCDGTQRCAEGAPQGAPLVEQQPSAECCAQHSQVLRADDRGAAHAVHRDADVQAADADGRHDASAAAVVELAQSALDRDRGRREHHAEDHRLPPLLAHTVHAPQRAHAQEPLASQDQLAHPLSTQGRRAAQRRRRLDARALVQDRPERRRLLRRRRQLVSFAALSRHEVHQDRVDLAGGLHWRTSVRATHRSTWQGDLFQHNFQLTGFCICPLLC